MLYMPGANARALEKARSLPCDGVILDLEDAVAPEAKETARRQVMTAVMAGGFGSREVVVRINSLDSAWGVGDLDAAVKARPDGILVPKISEPRHILEMGERLLDLAADHEIRIWAMIETPLAIINAAQIAATALEPESRLAGFIVGTNDLAKTSRVRQVPGRAPMLSWLADGVLAAHAYGLDILDGVYSDIGDAEGFRRECGQTRDMGFDGKTLIHPTQILPCNAVFTPTEAEVADARRVIAAFEAPDNQGKGVIQVGGRMVERLHVDIARRTVAIAGAIAQANAD